MKHTTTNWMPRGISDPVDSFNWLDQRRARSRRDFAELNDRLLTDIGVDRADRRIQINKPFWRA